MLSVFFLYARPAAATWQEDYRCYETNTCSGSSLTGSCTPRGFFCSDSQTCASYKVGNTTIVPNSCAWVQVVNCVPDPWYRCEIMAPDWAIGNRCDGYCKWISYNSCSCSCKEIKGVTASWKAPYCKEQCKIIPPPKP